MCVGCFVVVAFVVCFVFVPVKCFCCCCVVVVVIVLLCCCVVLLFVCVVLFCVLLMLLWALFTLPLSGASGPWARRLHATSHGPRPRPRQGWTWRSGLRPRQAGWRSVQAVIVGWVRPPRPGSHRGLRLVARPGRRPGSRRSRRRGRPGPPGNLRCPHAATAAIQERRST